MYSPPPEFPDRPAADPAAGGQSTSNDRRRFIRRTVAPGVIGSLMITIGSWGVSLPPPTTTLVDLQPFDALRHTAVGLGLARALLILGTASLLQAWLVLGYDVLHHRIRDVRRMWITLAAWVAPLMIAGPLFSRDVYSYFAQGRLIAAGFDPYANGVSVLPGWFRDGVDPLWGETPTPYGPFFLMIERAVATLCGPNPILGMLVLRLVSIAGIVLMAVYVPRLAFLHGIDPSKALWLGVLNPLVLMHFVAGAHNDALMVGLIIAGLTMAAEGKPIAGILLVTLGGAVKPIGLVVLPFAALFWAGTHASWRRRIGIWFATAAISLATIVAMGAVIGVSFGWVRALSTPGTVKTWLSPATGIGLGIGNLAGYLHLGDVYDPAVTITRGIGMLVAVVIVLRLLLKPEGRSPVRGAALALVAIVLLGPVIQAWYLIWPLPLLAVTGLRKPWHLRAIIIGTVGFVLYGLWEFSASADWFVDWSDALTMFAAAATIVLVVLASPRERNLVLGSQFGHGIVPEDAPSRARAAQVVVRAPA